MAEVAPDPRGAPDAGALRTFLIADIRGYTRFTEEQGDAAAARLAARFAAVTHEVVEARDGLLLELRGDEAVAVFASARQAMRAAVEAQLAYSEETQQEPSLPLPVGIGLDAGEAVPVAGGYRGAALNRAARLCAQATAGEILATESVLHLGGRVGGVTTTDRPVDALKGFTEAGRIVRLDPASTTLAAAALSGPPPASPVAAQPDGPPPLLLERDAVLRWLRGWWRIARRGRPVVLLVSGPRGSGRTSISAAFAAEVRRGTALVHVVDDTVTGPEGTAVAAALLAGVRDGRTPHLLVLDDLERLPQALAELPLRVLDEAADAPVLVIGLVDRGVLPDARGGLADLLRRLEATDLPAPRALPPLGADSVRRIAGLYAGDDAADAPVDAILEASDGLPARIHRLCAEWARTAAVHRLRSSARQAADGRQDLQRLEDAVAAQVIDLQLVRERAGLLVDAPAEDVVCPFKGLASFEQDDARYFFGRERLLADLIARLVGASFLGVVGPSGSGKSSVVRAGLVPALRSGVLPGSERWTVHVLRPGERPLHALSAVVRAPGAGDAGRHDPIEAALARLPTDDGRLVLVVDQFEEVFTAARDDAERVEFLRLLTSAARRPDRRVLVVVALRADLYDRCAGDPDLAQLMGANHVLVPPMQPDELRRAIELPARRAGLRVEPALVDALVEEVEGEPGALPLLSTALLELWQRREGRALTLERYRETGGVRGAVARLAEEAYGRLGPAAAARARTVMLRLASVEEDGTVVRRRASLREFDVDGDPDVGQVLDVFTAGRLLTAGEGRVEVAHEALLREWPRLRAWLDEDAEGRRIRGHLRDAADEWAAGGRDPGELYRGTRLTAASDWAATHGAELNALERTFLAESRAAAEREADRTRRTNRRLRTLLGLAVVLLAVALGAGGLALAQASDAERERAEADRQRATAEEQRLEADRQRAEAERAAAAATAQRLSAQALVDGRLDRSLLLATAGVSLLDTPESRGALLTTLLRSPAALRIHRHTGARLHAVAVSPTGETVAFSERGGNLILRDVAGDRSALLLEDATQAYLHLEFAPDGRHLAVIDLESVVYMEVSPAYEVVSERVFTLPGYPADLAIAADGRRIAATFRPEGVDDFGVAVVDLETGETRTTPARYPYLGAITWTGDDARVLAPSLETTYAFDAVDLRVVREYRGSDLREYAVAASPTGPLAARPGANGVIEIVDLEAETVTRLPRVHTAQVLALRFSADGSGLLSGGDDGLVVWWDMATREAARVFAGHGGAVLSVALTPDAAVAYSGALDGSVIAWDLTGRRGFGRSFHLGAPGGPVFGLRPDGTVVTDADRSIVLVDPATSRILDRFGPPLEVGRLAVRPDGGEVAAAVGDVVRRWELRDGRELPPLEHPGVGDGSVAYGADGTIATVGSDPELRVWSGNGERRGEVLLPGGLGHVVFAPNGQQLVVSAGPFAAVVDVQRVETVGDLAFDDTISAVAYSPDGRHLAIGDASGFLTVVDVAERREIGRRAAVSAGWVLSVAWAPDARTIATTGDDGSVRLVDWEAGTEVSAGFPDVAYHPAAVRFTPDGSSLIYLHDTGQGHVFPASVDAWVAAACELAGRSLTAAEREQYLPGRDVEVCGA